MKPLSIVDLYHPWKLLVGSPVVYNAQNENCPECQPLQYDFLLYELRSQSSVYAEKKKEQEWSAI
jgi:hypothetical protein